MLTAVMGKESVRAYYAHFGEREWLRLTSPDDGAIEFAITCHMLSIYLPPAGRILDIGGGPGRYTIWLAERGLPGCAGRPLTGVAGNRACQDC